MTNPTQEAFDELAARIMALAAILVEREICQVEDVDKAIVQCRQTIDQERAQARQKQMEELRASPLGNLFAEILERNDERVY